MDQHEVLQSIKANKRLPNCVITAGFDLVLRQNSYDRVLSLTHGDKLLLIFWLIEKGGSKRILQIIWCILGARTMETVTDFIFLGSKITADGD